MYRLLPLFLLLSCDKPDPKTEQPPYQDDDGDGLSVEDGDCNDEDSSISPQAAEVCDGIDQNCDGQADEGVLLTYYTDGDADGYGSGEVPACTAPTGSSTEGGDCDDSNPDISPAAAEICDGADNNCDGQVDDGATDAPTWYADQDGDGAGDPGTSTVDCAQPAGFVSGNTDCNDQEADIHPGASEICDGVDNNCDGSTDGSDAIDLSTWYADQDGDGFGDPARSTRACTPPAQTVS